MALTLLDPDTALIGVDRQKCISGLPAAHAMGGVTQWTGMSAIEGMIDLHAEFLVYGIKSVLPRRGETGTCQAIMDLIETRGG